jgi:hypothetical protein
MSRSGTLEQGDLCDMRDKLILCNNVRRPHSPWLGTPLARHEKELAQPPNSRPELRIVHTLSGDATLPISQAPKAIAPRKNPPS